MSDIKDEKKPLTRAEREAKRLEVLVETKNILVEEEKKKIEESFYLWTRQFHDMNWKGYGAAATSHFVAEKNDDWHYDPKYVSKKWFADFCEKVRALGYEEKDNNSDQSDDESLANARPMRLLPKRKPQGKPIRELIAEEIAKFHGTAAAHNYLGL